LNKYIRNVEIRTNRNEIDILNLKSENKFIVEELTANKKRNEK